jgi:hypothetical protein
MVTAWVAVGADPNGVGEHGGWDFACELVERGDAAFAGVDADTSESLAEFVRADRPVGPSGGGVLQVAHERQDDHIPRQ